MKKKTLTSNFLVKVLPYILISPCLSAQEHISSSTDEVQLAPVTVTANKIEEDLIDVPQSVTVIDDTMIDEIGMKDIADVLDAVPAVEILPTSPVRSSVNIRGLNSSLFTNNNPIVIYVDGIPYSDSYGFDLSLVNVERIEILRGPQGTLYGKDAIGGVVNVISKEPTNEWEGEIESEFGKFNSIGLQFRAGGALKEDELYLSVSGQYRADDGWVTNDFPGNEHDANQFDERRLSTSLTYQPTDAFRVKFSASNNDTDSFGIGGYGVLSTDSEGLSFSDTFSRDVAEDITAEFETKEELNVNSQALQLTYEFDAFTINFVTTHRDQRLKGIYDYHEGNTPFLVDAFSYDNQSREVWTQELILRSNGDEGLRYVAGVYFETEEREQGPYGQKLFGTTYGAESVADSSTAAVLGQFIYPLTEVLELTLGGRYQRIEQEIDLDFIVEDLPLPPTYTTLFSGVAHTVDGEQDLSVFLSRAALSYKVNDNWTVYGSFAEGYMPGGFNYFASSGTADDNSFKSQRSTNYEIGVKAQTDKMAFAAAVFYMEIEDIHVWRQDDLGNLFTGNADKAHSKGVEVEIAYQLTKELELSASAGLIEAEYDDYFTTAYDYSGQDIEQTPEYTFNLAATYYHPKGFYARTDLSAAGRTGFFDGGRPAPETAFPERDAYAVVNARIGYLSGDWEIYAYADNLNNEEYITSLRGFNLGPAISSIVTYNDPRSFGVGARYSF